MCVTALMRGYGLMHAYVSFHVNYQRREPYVANMETCGRDLFFLLAASPCTAGVFPNEYRMMPLVIVVAAGISLVLLLMLLEGLLLSGLFLKYAERLYHVVLNWKVRWSLRLCLRLPGWHAEDWRSYVLS